MPILGLTDDGVVGLRFELVDQRLADNGVVALGMQQGFAATTHGLLRDHILVGKALAVFIHQQTAIEGDGEQTFRPSVL